MKTNYKLAVAMLAGITLGAVPQGYAQGPDAHSTATPDQLEWKDVPALGPGVKLALIEGPMNEAVPFMVRIKFPAGARVPPHWHPAIEHVTVMSGTFEIGIGDKLDESKTMRFPAGIQRLNM